MRSESHVVDGNLNYLHLLDAEADHYRCFQCGRSVAIEVLQNSNERTDYR